MKEIKRLAATSALSLAMAFSASTGATTISEFDHMTADERSVVLSNALNNLLGNTVANGSTELGKCMVDYFMKVEASTGATIPTGILVLSAQLELQRKKGASSTVDVEAVVRAVYAQWLQQSCLKDHPVKLPNGSP